jgi:hypothetical protein
MTQTMRLKAAPKPPLRVEPLYGGRMRGSGALRVKSTRATVMWIAFLLSIQDKSFTDSTTTCRYAQQKTQSHGNPGMLSEEQPHTSPPPIGHYFFRKPPRLLFVTSGCHASLSPLVDTPGCHFDRKREKEENLIRPGIAPARLSRILKVPGSVL